jgi:hypothetical protein
MLSKLLKSITNIKALVNEPPPVENINFDYYYKKIKSDEWDDKVVFGVSEFERGFAVRDPVDGAGALYFGATGSGKSKSMKFTIYTHYLVNADKAFYILFDSEKGMTDYKSLFPFKDNVVVATGSEEKFVVVMDFLFKEYLKRKEAFSKLGASDIKHFDRLMKKIDPNWTNLARIVFAIEEFHTIPNHPKIKFDRNSDNPDTAAGQLKIFSRVARSFGIFFYIATQKATSEDVPGDVKQSTHMMMGHMVKSHADAAVANLPQCEEIKSTQKGRCAYENGWMQYPFIPDDAFDEFLKQNKKPFKARLLAIKPEVFQLALSGNGSENMVLTESYTRIVKAASQFNQKTIAKRFLERFGFTVNTQEESVYVAQFIAERSGKKYAVYVNEDTGSDRMYGSSRGIGKSELKSLDESISSLECNSLIVFDFSERGGELDSLVEKHNGILVNLDDLKYAASALDNEKTMSEPEFKKRYLNIKLNESYDSGSTEDSDEDSDDFGAKFKIRSRTKF